VCDVTTVCNLEASKAATPEQREANARFIAWARDAVPALAADRDHWQKGWKRAMGEFDAKCKEANVQRARAETAEAEAAALREENARLRTDCGILLAQIDATEEVHGVGPEDEDAALVAQIRAPLATPPQTEDKA
jgi:hypothetical protein